MPADIIPFKPTAEGEKSSRPADSQYELAATLDEPFGEQFWEKIVASDRADRARIDGEWKRIRSYILDSHEKLNGQLPTVNPCRLKQSSKDLSDRPSTITYGMQNCSALIRTADQSQSI